jgi:hypothetical protein
VSAPAACAAGTWWTVTSQHCRRGGLFAADVDRVLAHWAHHCAALLGMRKGTDDTADAIFIVVIVVVVVE